MESFSKLVTWRCRFEMAKATKYKYIVAILGTEASRKSRRLMIMLLVWMLFLITHSFDIAFMLSSSQRVVFGFRRSRFQIREKASKRRNSNWIQLVPTRRSRQANTFSSLSAAQTMISPSIVAQAQMASSKSTKLRIQPPTDTRFALTPSKSWKPKVNSSTKPTSLLAKTTINK